MRGHGLSLLLDDGGLRAILLQQRLEGDEAEKSEGEDKEHAAISAGFLLRILIVGQSLIQYLSLIQCLGG